ncbi:MAG: 3-phenylpropionate/trans-cinnamate dioxygenase ferredoxin component [Actinomycetota bacterium]|jgi:nitrite reductase/ring-hydroxylating ferredoxin subunit|nr:3-phenylpropionate/trans-cinnamate dioxygenase ferredoxin component [Actinomycetota bacterium]
MGEFVTVGQADEVVEGQATQYGVGGQEIAVARIQGKLMAFSDICTHRGCNLAGGGEIDGTTIECECHGSVFDMATGAVVESPAVDPLPVFAVREQDGVLQIEV